MNVRPLLLLPLLLIACDSTDGDPGAIGADTVMVDDTSSDEVSEPPSDTIADTTPDPDVGEDAADIGEDTGPTLPTSGPRAFVITEEHTAELAAGPMADARVGDIVITNDVVRFVIRTGPEALYLHGLGGGAVVDAGTPQTDRLQEIVPLGAFNSFGDTSVTITDNGAGGIAEVVVTGSAKVPSIVGAYLQFEQRPDLTQTYRLEPGSNALEMTVELGGMESGQTGDVLFVGGDVDPVVDEGGRWLASSGPDISYGVVSDDDLSLSELGGITILLGPTLEVPIKWTRWLVVGDGSLSSVLDTIYDLRMIPTANVSGTVDDPDVEVVARTTDGELVTSFRPDASGAFSGRLPVGLYDLRAEGPGRPAGAPVSADVVEGTDLTGLSVSAEPASFLRVTADGALRLSIGGEVIPVAPGTTDVPLAPGTYEIWASRGYEWEVDSTEITLEAGETEEWAPVLVRSVDTTGWIASDFHLHSEWSADSNVPLPMRVLACAAEGIEYAVATDHDVITDYGPRVPESIADDIVIGIGMEVSTAMLGHINVWPLTPDPDRAGRGSFAWHGLDFPELMDLLAPETPGRVVQINHGRNESISSFFDRIGYDPHDPDGALLAEMRFTAMELFNAGGSAFDDLLVDWMSFVDAGLPVAATGTSDAHSVGALCGTARTWVEVTDDDPASAVATDINAGVLARRTLVSSGPFVTITQVGPGTVHVRIAGPSWMPIETLTLYADGVIDQTIAIPAYDDDVVRFDQDVTLNNTGAAWAVALVQADPIPQPILKRKIAALTPAIFLQDQ